MIGYDINYGPPCTIHISCISYHLTPPCSPPYLVSLKPDAQEASSHSTAQTRELQSFFPEIVEWQLRIQLTTQLHADLNLAHSRSTDINIFRLLTISVSPISSQHNYT